MASWMLGRRLKSGEESGSRMEASVSSETAPLLSAVLGEEGAGGGSAMAEALSDSSMKRRWKASPKGPSASGGIFPLPDSEAASVTSTLTVPLPDFLSLLLFSEDAAELLWPRPSSSMVLSRLTSLRGLFATWGLDKQKHSALIEAPCLKCDYTTLTPSLLVCPRVNSEFWAAPAFLFLRHRATIMNISRRPFPLITSRSMTSLHRANRKKRRVTARPQDRISRASWKKEKRL